MDTWRIWTLVLTENENNNFDRRDGWLHGQIVILRIMEQRLLGHSSVSCTTYKLNPDCKPQAIKSKTSLDIIAYKPAV